MWMLLILLSNPPAVHPCPLQTPEVIAAQLKAVVGRPVLVARFAVEGDPAAAGQVLAQRIQDAGGRVDGVAVKGGGLEVQFFLPDGVQDLGALTVPGRVAIHTVDEAASKPDQPALVQPPALGAEDFEPCKAVLDPDYLGGRGLSLTLTPAAAERFAALSAAQVGKRLALVLDGQALSLPVVMEKITGGKVMLTGAEVDAKPLILQAILRSGPLPAMKLASVNTP